MLRNAGKHQTKKMAKTEQEKKRKLKPGPAMGEPVAHQCREGPGPNISAPGPLGAEAC
jgi:hypothetical protein